MNLNEELFRLVPKPPPSEFVSGYIKEHPNRTWQDNLIFLADNFPQVQNGQMQYFIEGGTAVKLLHPRRIDPGDIDFVTRSEELALQFSSASGLDAKSVNLWFKFRERALFLSLENIERLFGLTQEVEFNGRTVHILTPPALAMSKYPGLWFQERKKDVADINLLGVSLKEIEEIKRQLS